MNLFHKHQWKVLQEITTESLADREGGLTGYVSEAYNLSVLKSLYSKKHITILTCETCGKLKRYVEDI